MKNKKKNCICVFGLGYVGLPLAIEFGKKILTIGFDISKLKIDDLNRKISRDKIVTKNDFKNSKNLTFTADESFIKKANVIIVCLPTPIDIDKKPDLSILIKGTKKISKNLSKGTLIIYESTVYPTTTESICVPILEKYSGLKHKIDFNVGYSPERINPGDTEHKLTNISKVVSGDTLNTALRIKKIYNKIIKAKIFIAKNIKIAEAAKIIENTQRDLNIALINELSIIFKKINIDIKDVLNAAATKWNFLRFTPGLVGGHCIGVDPYYLTYFSKKIGHTPIVINAGRDVNDSMTRYVINNILKFLKKRKIKINKAKILILGISFKKNCTDIRNSKILEIVDFFKLKKSHIQLYDPLIDKKILLKNNLRTYSWQNLKNNSDIMIIFSYHDQFKKISIRNIKKKVNKQGIIFDLMSELSDNKIKKIKRRIWRL
jgi:UDP-N-acetyl-D-galactosamine dehydrogenase